MLSISNLNYEKLYSRLVARSWIFFTCVVLWVLPAALMRHDETPRLVTDPTTSNYSLPISASWLYVPFQTAIQMDDKLASAWAERMRDNSTCTYVAGYEGWVEFIGWGQHATHAWDSFTGR